MREGLRFRRVLQEINSTQWLSAEQLDQFQLAKLRALIDHAGKHVPYYRELFGRLGLTSGDINSINDLQAIPYLTKEDVLRDGQRLIATNIRGFRVKGATSGTTGTPLVILQNLDSVIRENAFVWRQLHWAGFRKGQRRAWIRGDMIVPFEQKRPPFWRMNWADNMLMMSSYHMSPATVQDYIDALQSFDPVLVQAYPSAISYLARFLEDRGQHYKGHNLCAIVTTSETLTDTDKTIIEERMVTRVFDHYGTLERVVMIQTCEKGTYHVNSDYGIMELLPNTDGTAEIVGTGFNNWLMPLIRYRSGDVAETESKNHRCPCGRKLPVVRRIYGRLDDYVQTPDGRRIARLGHIFKGLHKIAEGQLIQNKLGEVHILVVPFGVFGKEDEKKLTSQAQEYLGKDMKVTVEPVPTIPRTKRGKVRNVICNI